MPAEDFSYFQKVVPGFYYFLGVANRQRGITAGWHTPEFDVDEESLVVGVKGDVKRFGGLPEAACVK